MELRILTISTLLILGCRKEKPEPVEIPEITSFELLPDTLTISGVVKDEHDRPLARVKMELRTSGDADNDGDVDLPDWGEFQQCFGSSSAECSYFDFDKDGIVSILDCMTVLSHVRGPFWNIRNKATW